MSEKSALSIIITDAGRRAAVDADHNGLQIELTEIALGKALWSPDASATGLKEEFKRLKSFGGADLSADMLHFTITDDGDDAYKLGEFGLYTDTGVLFAVYSQQAVISEKIKDSVFMLSVDIKIDSVPPDSVTITGNNFHYPPAKPDVLGVIFDAPNDGKNYVRNNGKWLEVPPQDNEWRPGDIKMFAGSSNQIQDGWKLCDGSGVTSNGIRVPDLRDRFVIGSGRNYYTGETGGSTSASTNSAGNHSHGLNIHNTTLSLDQMPHHRHLEGPCYPRDWVRFGYIDYHSRNGAGQGGGGQCTPYSDYSGSSGSHYHGANIYDSGSHGHTVQTMPPYYSLAFIIKM